MCRLKAALLVVFGSIFACSLTFAQGHTQSDSSPVCRIQVRVAYADERPVGQRIRVELLNAQGVQVEQTFTDGEGQATFQITGGGTYRAQASGPDIEQAVSELVDIQPHDQMSMIWLHVQPKAGATSAVTSQEGLQPNYHDGK